MAAIGLLSSNRKPSDAELKKKLIASGAIPAPSSPEDMGNFLKAEYERWGKIVKERGIKEGS